MERYEVRVKFEEIKKLTDKGDYQSAMEIADTVDWDRVKNISMLCSVGEIYERCRYYEDSKAIYERAYKIQPQSRITVYRLANISIKLKEFDEANAYLDEYREIVPYDSNVLVLTYRIRKGQQADISELIAILEKLKEKDYHEKWAYELAVLYAEAGEEEKCAKECDTIFLWFGEGRYVSKALKLKSLFRTLTTEQDRYINTASATPVGAEETIERREAAVRETEENQKEFLELQEKIEKSDLSESDTSDMVRDMEDARQKAIDASREAKAAELLNEAAEESRLQEESNLEDDEQRMLDETKIPMFNIPIMDILNASAMESNNDVSESIDTKDNIPGTEFIDMTSFESYEDNDVTEAKEQSESIEEAKSRILSMAKDTEDDLQLIGYDIKEEEPEPQLDTIEFESQRPKYTSMGDLLAHADEMSSDELANNLADVISGKTEEKPDTEKVEESVKSSGESPMGILQDVISRIWTKSAARKIQRDREYNVDSDIDNIEIKDESLSRYDTINLQKDLANSINHILNATETDEIDKTIAILDKNMKDSNISKYAEITKEEELPMTTVKQWDEELSDVISEETRKKIEEYDLLDSLEQEVDGQIKLMVDPVTVELDIPGQINIEDYMQEQKQHQLEEAKIRAIKIAGEYMDQVSKAAPLIALEEAEKYLADSQKALLVRTKALMESTNPDEAEIESVMNSLCMMIAYANERACENLDQTEIGEVSIVEDTDETADSDIEQEIAAAVEVNVEPEEISEELAVAEELTAATEEPEDSADDEAVATDAEDVADVTDTAEDIITVPPVSEETLEKMNESKEKFMDSISNVSPKEVADVDKKKADAQVVPMTDEQWEIMDYFMNVPEVEEQIVNFIETQHTAFENLVICGNTGSGRSSLALRLYKSIRLNNPELPNQTLKVDADALNKKSVLKVYEKISSGIVIIEHAGLLNDVAVAELEEAMKLYEGKIYTIIIGTAERISKLLENSQSLSRMCKYKFEIPEYSLDQYVDFAKNYAYSYGYVIDDTALLALYSDLSAIKTKNKMITLQDVKLIINDAIVNNEKRTKKLFTGLFASSKDKEGNIILKEKDFVI